MNDLPLRPGVFDIVFMTGTLHHSSDLSNTMRQVAAALAPGGTAVVINEPVQSLVRKKNLAGCLEVEHGINEQVYRIYEYLWATWRAGLRSRLYFPASISKHLDQDDQRMVQEMV